MKNKIFQLMILCCAISLLADQAIAQPKQRGELIENISVQDIHGNDFDLYSYLDQGYSVFVDISATWCPPCWMFHQTGVMQKLYEKYGPEGTVNTGKILPVFIEGDTRTSLDDLKGKGKGTLGDWVTGKDYPIIEMNSDEVIQKFFREGTESFTFPTFFMICPDRKVRIYQSGFSADMTDDKLVNWAKACESSPSSLASLSNDVRLSLWPNPVNDILVMSVGDITEKIEAAVKVVSLSGAVVFEKSMLLGKKQAWVDMSEMVPGMYLLSVTDKEGHMIRRKFIKQ